MTTKDPEPSPPSQVSAVHTAETLPRGASPPPGFMSRTTTLPPGHELDGRFSVVKLLGRGAMGAVYLARDNLLGGEQVVLKLLTSQGAAAPAELDLFRREVLTARSVVHPSVVRVFDFHMLNGIPAITMEYLPGGTLEELRGQKPSTARWLALMAEVAEALGAIHAAGLVHRDLKPQNVMLGKDGRARVTDFGIAGRSSTQDKASGHYTPMFASPEQIRREPVSTHADVYALGAMAYYLISGQPPFPREALLEGHLSRPPPSLLAAVPEVPPAIDRLICRAMDKDARRRPDADTLARQFREAALQLEPTRDATVMRIDLVAYPQWATQQQEGAIQVFTEVLAESVHIKTASALDLVKLPLHDGVVLVFLRSTVAAYEAAMTLAEELKANNLSARIGLHQGSVKLVAALNGTMSAVGGGVSACERFMAAGTEGHILVSDRFRNTLVAEHPEFSAELRGPHQVTDRQGGTHVIWNVKTEELGQDFVPPTAAAAPATSAVGAAGSRAKGAVVAASVVAAGALGLLAWQPWRAPGQSSTTTSTPAPVVVAPPAPTPAPAPIEAPSVDNLPPVAAQPTSRVPTPAPAASPARPPRKGTAPTTASPAAAPPATAPVATAPAKAPAPQREPEPAPQPPRATPPATTAPAPADPAPALDRGTAARVALQDGSQAMREGNFQGAVTHAEAALKLDPTLSGAHKVLGMAHARLKNFCASKTHYQAYLKLNPTAENAPGVRKALEAPHYAECP